MHRTAEQILESYYAMTRSLILADVDPEALQYAATLPYTKGYHLALVGAAGAIQRIRNSTRELQDL